MSPKQFERANLDPGVKEPPREPAPYHPGATTFWNNSWRQIYGQFAGAILAYARQSGLNEHSAEDVLQEVMMSLIRSQQGQETGYDGRGGSFQAWLWGVIRNRVRSVRRKDRKEPPASPVRGMNTDWQAGDALPEVPQPPPDFDAAEEERWQQALLAAALHKVQERVTPENFAIYTALLEENAAPEDVGRRYGKDANAIYAVKHRCEKMLIAEGRSIRSAWEQLR